LRRSAGASDNLANSAAAPMTITLTAHTRSVFDTDLQELARMVAEMGRLAERQLAQAFNSLAQRNIQLARQTIDLDTTLDAFQSRIEKKGIDIIAQRQPLAIDLREIIAALHLSNDLERIGDLAKNISKRAVAIGNERLPESLIHGFEHMTRLVMEQFNVALDSYAARDIAAALEVRNGDVQIDALNNALFREALVYMGEDPDNIATCTHILFCIKNLERIGDHATNIAESVHYMIVGRLPENERPKGNNTSFAAA
jgi:phosphate transport system protein